MNDDTDRPQAGPRAPAPALDVRELRMRYGTVDVLRGVNLRVRQGEVLALLGPNGAGKTTTIEILEGFRRRSSGAVAVLGADPDDGAEAWRARLGIVLQSWTDHRRWQVRDLLEHIGRYYRPYGTPGRPRPYDTDELLGRVGLDGQAATRISRLSGGQRRRLDVAIGLVGNPELLFLDEPTVGFDPHARRDFHELIGRISGVGGTSIVLTTHDLAEAEKLAHRIAILIDGRIVADGTAGELSARYSGTSEVSYELDGVPHSVSTEDPVGLLKELLGHDGGSVIGLEVRPARLEDTYLRMVADEQVAGRA